MDKLRNSVQNFFYEEKDPLLIYKGEAFNIFFNILKSLNNETVSFIFFANLLKLDVKFIKKECKNFIYL
jgi:preprotein translocase subunit SecA